MIDQIRNILQELGYTSKEDGNDSFSMLSKESEDYFLIAEYEASEIVEFFTSPKTKSIISYFQDEKQNNSAINKNTSLIILVKTDNLAKTLETYKNSVFDIEEDEYILRKYVVVYTEEGANEINGKSINELNEALKDAGRFSRYQDYETRHDDQAYFLIMQLFVKLPPLSFTGYENDFESIRDRINSSIGSSGMKLVQHILETTDADVKENRSMLLEVQNDDFDEWLSNIMTRISDETS